MTDVISAIAPLFLVIAGSAVIARLVHAGEEWSDVLNAFALHVGFPALVISALTRAGDALWAERGVLVVNSLFLLAVFAFALAVGRLLGLGRRAERTFFLCLGFGNVAYLGIPILERIGGASVLPAASLIVAVYLFWIFTLAIGRLEFLSHREHGDALRRTAAGLARNPLLLSVVAGLLLAAAGIRLPGVLAASLDMIAASVTPVVLILIGLFFGRARAGSAAEWLPALAFSCATLLVLPAGLCGGLILFGFRPAEFSVSVIQAAMPLAITPFALARMYDLDREFIARAIVLSTMLSAFTIPLWISLL